MSDTCKLNDANGRALRHCDEDRCVYWRVAGHLGVDENESGCAIQHFQMLDGGRDVASWLMSVKDRVEGAASTQC